MSFDPNTPQIPHKTTNVMLLATNAALGCVFVGYNLTIFNPAQNYIAQVVYPGISKHLIYLMTSFTPLGAAFGSILGGKLASLYGRRASMIWADIFSMLCVLLTLIKNEYILLLGRLLVGICIGWHAPTTTIYLAEISPVVLRGMTCIFNPAGINLGILIAYLFGLNIPTGEDANNSEWWRIMLGFSGILALIRLINFIFFIKNETPKYLVITEKDEQAKEALSQIYCNEEDIQLELDILKQELRQAQIAGTIAYRDLWSPHYKQRFVIANLLLLCQQFSGGSAILLYSTQIFRQAGLISHQFTPEFFTVIVGVLTLCMSILVGFVIVNTGRRTLLLSGGTALLLSLLFVALSGLLGGGFNAISVTFVYTSIASWACSFGSIPWVYLAEVLPDLGVGIAQSLNWIECFITAQSVPYLIDTFGASWTFLIFAGICLIAVLFVLRWVKETKDKNALEIAEIFSNKNKDKRDYEEEKKLLEKQS